MSERAESAPAGGSQANDTRRLIRAKEVFLAVHALGAAEREPALDEACAGDEALRALVRDLLRGDEAPLPFESLAEDIRAARSDSCETRSLESADPGAGTSAHRIGNYRLLERLGEGGFGAVFMAEQERPVRRRVALKIIKLGMDTRRVVARFEAERQALAMMDHPGIARVFDAGATETGRPYFVMELVRGLPISIFCDSKKLSIRERLGLVIKVCEALQHAHQKGIIHRDIKPGNVLVTEVSGKPQPKIIDFGVAKATNARLTEKTLFTELRQMIGTPEYMSPEQASPTAEEVDTRTDIYSVGVLLYELLTGTTPFESRQFRSVAYEEVQRIIREEDPPRPSFCLTRRSSTLASAASVRSTEPLRLRGEISGELDWIVMKALEKDRAQRYESASALARDIENYLQGRAVEAAPPSRLYYCRKLARRHRDAVIVGALLLVALTAALVVTSLSLVNAQNQRRIAEAERGRADASAAVARKSESLANRRAYSASMLSACAAVASNQYAMARVFLSHAPEALRGWEWATLNAQLDSSLRSLACPMPSQPDEAHWSNFLLAHPDGDSFFTTHIDGRAVARRWDIATGRLLAQFEGAACSPVNPPRFGLVQGGSRLAACSGWPASVRTVIAWNVEDGSVPFRAEIPVADSRTVSSMSPDFERLACLHNDSSVSLIRLPDGELLMRTPPESVGLEWSLFSPDGSKLVIADAHGGLHVRDGHTLAPVALLQGHHNLVRGMHFSPDGRWLGTASIDGTARVWDLQSSPPSSIVLKHPSTVVGVCLSSDAGRVATSSRDRSIRVWDTKTAELKATFISSGLLGGPVMFLPDGNTVAGLEGDGTVRFWDISAEATVNIRGHMGLVNSAVFLEKPGLIASAGWDGWRDEPGCARLWDASTGDEIASFGEPGQVAHEVASSRDGSIAVFNLRMTHTPRSPPARIAERALIVVDTISGRVVEHELATERAIAKIAVDPGGGRIAVGGSGPLHILESRTGIVLAARAVDASDATILPFCFSADGRQLLCAMGEDRAMLLNAQSLQTVREFESSGCTSMAFAPDGAVCIGGRDGVLNMFDAETGQLLRTLAAHDRLIASIDFTPDGARLATAGGEAGEILVWNAATLDRVARFREEGFISSVDWSHDGARLLVSCERTLRVWDPIPLRDRVSARSARREALARLEPQVSQLARALGDPALALEQFIKDPTTSELDQIVARHIVMGLAVRRPLRSSR